MYSAQRLGLLLVVLTSGLTLHVAAQNRGLPGFGQPHANLEPPLERVFAEGRDEFRERDDVADGLGPVFNDRSCAACHDTPATGGGSNRTVTRFGRSSGTRFDPMAERGGSLVQARGIGTITTRDGDTHTFAGENVPADATIRTRRRTTPLFGLGLVDAVPDATFRALAREQARAAGGITGRVNVVVNLVTGQGAVGKFGWKAQVPSLFQFAADAYLNEMGLTNPLFPDEVCPQGDCAQLDFNPTPALNDDGTDVQALAEFMTLLGPPPRGEITDEVRIGEAVFLGIGCATCHVPTLTTGPSEITALSGVTFQPYSDFLLHDVGSLGDGIEQGTATGSEMRTAPLWGLRVIRRFLHDGSAISLEQAIQRHDGEARRARDRFAALDPERAAALVAFLRSL